jgi:D-alanyl-D-alanine carboxypeptidase
LYGDLKIKLLNLFLMLILVLGPAFMISCSRSYEPEQAEAKLEALLLKTVTKDETLRNAVLLVESPKLGINRAWAAGIADEHSGAAMTVETPFLSASIGKLFTAILVMSLTEEGLLSLDDSIVDWLDASVITGLPVLGGEAALKDITIHRLLAQRSGLPDYFEGESTDGAPNVFELISEDPERSWTPILLLDYVKEHYAPAGAPGEAFLYADTNYDLLGLIVEEASGQALHEVMTERIFQPLGLQNTWMHARSTAPGGRRSSHHSRRSADFHALPPQRQTYIPGCFAGRVDGKCNRQGDRLWIQPLEDPPRRYLLHAQVLSRGFGDIGVHRILSLLGARV